MTSVRLVAGAAELVLAPCIGGRVRSWRYKGQDLIRPIACGTFDLNSWPPEGAFPLIPFGGRIRNGCFEFQSQSVQMALAAGETHALHGISSRKPWQLSQATDGSATIELKHKADRFWPWDFEAEQEFTLSEQELRIRLALRNPTGSDMPGAIGWHPSFVKASKVRSERSHDWSFDRDQIPVERKQAGDNRLSGELVFLENADRTTVTFLSPLELICETDRSIRHAVVYDQERGRTCWEPISHLPCPRCGVEFPTVAAHSSVEGRVALKILS